MAKIKDYMTTQKERLSFGSFYFGQNVFHSLVYGLLATYLLLNGLSPTMTAGAFLIVKTWDAINDLLFGGIVDKIKFKKDKFLPWLRISIVFVPFTTIMLFAIPTSISPLMKLVWFTIAYVLYDLGYTMTDVPLIGLTTVMTNKTKEKNLILTYGKMFGLFGATLGSVTCTILVGETVGMSYTSAVIACSAVAVLFMLPLIFFGKERCPQIIQNDEKIKFKDMWNCLVSNKMLLIFSLGLFFVNGFNVINLMIQLTAFYVFENADLAVAMGVLAILPTLVLGFFMPKIIKKIDKFKLVYWGNALSAITLITLYFVGYDNFAIYIIFISLNAIARTPTMFCVQMFITDCVVYGCYKTQSNSKGVPIALHSFLHKLSMSLASFIGVFLLGFFGWQTVTATSFQELAAQGVTQTAQAVDGLWMIINILPALGSVIALIIWAKYKLIDKDVEIMAMSNSGEISREEAAIRLSIKV